MPHPLADSNARRAYLTTKLVVFVVAAGATWPLARAFGPRAWIGLGVFGAILVLTAAALLLSARFSASADDAGDSGDEPAEIDPEIPFEILVEDFIDLHPFPPRDVPEVVSSYLEAAVEKGFAEVRLIHGRGIGVQRERVRSLLATHPLVREFHDAPPDRGGWGATIAYLKR